MGWLERYQRGRRAALAEYGIGGGDPPQPWPDDPLPQPEWSDDPAPLPPDPGSSPGQADAVSARVAELETQLAELQTELLAAREAHAKDDRLIAELREMVDQDQACTVELEAQAVAALVERDQLMEVLKLPGLRKLLAKEYSRNKHPEATEDVKRVFEDYSKKINAAYNLIKKDARAKKSDEAA